MLAIVLLCPSAAQWLQTIISIIIVVLLLLLKIHLFFADLRLLHIPTHLRKRSRGFTRGSAKFENIQQLS